MNKDDNPSYNLSWVVAISIFPLFCGLAYIVLKLSQKFPKESTLHYKRRLRSYLKQSDDVMKEMYINIPDTCNLANYVKKFGPYPVYRNEEIEYFPLGELQFEAMLKELEKAKKFIFMEFFIISKGYMFNRISEILTRKAKEGLDVRLMYDGIGTGMLSLPARAFDKLKAQGVKCKVFTPFTPIISSLQNNRDHRKTIIIDGITAFNGGANLADEYINRKERFGHWKDTGIMVKGETVWNFTVMFLQLWEFGDRKKSDYTPYKAIPNNTESVNTEGYIQPFAASPLDNEKMGKLVYTELINTAKNYVYITTPYLILDHDVFSALQFAAKKGVDVRIILPHIPDKWYVHCIAWNTYPKLIKSGVKIYEYTPGFIHSKSMIADGKTAVIGTINLDYRSLYLHFESASILYNCSVIEEMKQDFNDTLSISQRITIEDCKNRSLFNKIAGCIFKIFSPLL